MDTLLLDVELWDLTVDAAGNIAVAAEPYALAQDAASAVKLFLRELWYDNTQGVDWFKKILGQSPHLEVFQSLMVAAVLTVPGIVSAVCIVEDFDRETEHVTGQIQFIDVNGNNGNISLGNPA